MGLLPSVVILTQRSKDFACLEMRHELDTSAGRPVQEKGQG